MIEVMLDGRRRRVRRPARRALLYAALITTTVIMIGPLYWMLATSFKPAGDVFASPPKCLMFGRVRDKNSQSSPKWDEAQS